MTPSAAPYPLLFEPMLFEKVWGGHALKRLGKVLPDNAKVGESWELADMPVTSTSGAGGNAARSIIRNGPMQGRTLGHAVAAWGQGLLGPAQLTVDGGFPLLIKFLDATENLSVQVHPSPAYARANPACKLKTECWFILHADPDSAIYKGVRPGVSRRAFEQAIIENSVADVMNAVPAIVGECHNLPSGTCHALGKGVLVAEVQTPSDTTFRVYDWGRTGRELHVQQALDCIDFGPAPAGTRKSPHACAERLVSNEAFVLDEFTPRPHDVLGMGLNGRCVILIMLGGHATLQGKFDTVALKAGDTCLIPAAIADDTVLTADGVCTFLRAAVGH